MKVNTLCVGTPLDSTQVQQIKSVSGTPLGWSFINGSCISFALSSKLLNKLKSRSATPTDYFGEGGSLFTTETLKDLRRIMVEIPKEFIDLADDADEDILVDGTFGIMKMAQPRYTDYDSSHPELHKSDNFITPYMTPKNQSRIQERKAYSDYMNSYYSKPPNNPYSSKPYQAQNSDFWAEHPPLPSYFKSKFGKTTVMIDLSWSAIEALLSSDWGAGFYAEGSQWIVFSVPAKKISSMIYFENSTQPLTFIKELATSRPPIDFFGLFNWLNLRKS